MIKDTRDPTKVTGKEDSQDGKREDQEMDVEEPEEEQDKLGLPRGHLLYINIE